MLLLQRIVGVEAERNFYESQLIILDTLEKVLNSVRILQISSVIYLVIYRVSVAIADLLFLHSWLLAELLLHI